MMNKYNELGKQLDVLVKIAADGKIAPEEVEAYSRIDKVMRHLRQKITTLSCVAL